MSGFSFCQWELVIPLSVRLQSLHYPISLPRAGADSLWLHLLLSFPMQKGAEGLPVPSHGVWGRGGTELSHAGSGGGSRSTVQGDIEGSSGQLSCSLWVELTPGSRSA